MINEIKKNIILILNKKILLLLVVISMFVVGYISKKETGSIYMHLVLGNQITNSLIYLINSLIIIGYFIWSSYYVYTYDIYNNSEFIFLRKNKNKWLIQKYISIFIVNIVIQFILMIFFIIICFTFSKNYYISELFEYFIIMLVLKTFIQYFVINLLNVLDIYGIILMVIMLSIPFISQNFNVTILNYLYPITFSNRFIGILVLIIMCILMFFISKKTINKFIEREVI